MKDLLGFNWVLHGMVHAGSYDSQDFLGRLVGDKPWVRHAEQSFYHAFDHNYFATAFHIEMFMENLLGVDLRTGAMRYMQDKQIIRTGWPMEYERDVLSPYKSLNSNLILPSNFIIYKKLQRYYKGNGGYTISSSEPANMDQWGQL
jgi:hypothetical protein